MLLAKNKEPFLEKFCFECVLNMFKRFDQDESGTKKKKEKSSRDKDGSKKEKPDKGGGESGKKEKKKKKKKESAVEDEGRNELEAFLNDGGGYESL